MNVFVVAGLALSLVLPVSSVRTLPSQADRYTWCEALSAPPLTRYVSNVFLVPSGSTVDLTIPFSEVVKAKHHPKPQELACDGVYATKAEADVAHGKRVAGTGAVLRMPIVLVDWAHTAP